ncbi:hypothetical protein L3476_18395 [Paenibacillus thiaminolyticus]|uniref:Gfo/Idh/MocA family oxidoreductase n=1 Tax=Paenibacillus thiaminolyticus TaxID=49283 RepID=UPI0023502A7A|nr:Gfo/Idh/MocA family oxidoreductase [Paenibacillus thiaminolyticus]WCR25311.1 hypothetical protein L3476_18395 [Paenibacillus thiaminolyticus]
MLRIGIIGLDTSHVTAFTALLNDATHPYHVLGGQVVAAYQGGTPGLELSMSRLKAYTDELIGQYGVTLVPDLPSLAEQCDVLLLESVDGGVHEAQFAAVASFAKPVFIDKPLALSTASASRIADLAARYGTPIMSSSALRYAEALTSAVKEVTAEAEGGPYVQGVDAFGPTPRGRWRARAVLLRHPLCGDAVRGHGARLPGSPGGSGSRRGVPYRPLGGRARGDDPRPPGRTVRRARTWRAPIALCGCGGRCQAILCEPAGTGHGVLPDPGAGRPARGDAGAYRLPGSGQFKPRRESYGKAALVEAQENAP